MYTARFKGKIFLLGCYAFCLGPEKKAKEERSTRQVKPRFTWLIPQVKDIPAQWAKIRQGLDIFRIGSKCVCLSNGEV